MAEQAEIDALRKALVNLVATARPHVDNGSRSLSVAIERADDALAASHPLRASHGVVPEAEAEE